MNNDYLIEQLSAGESIPRPHYPQPRSINLSDAILANPALAQRESEREHMRAKYAAKRDWKNKLRAYD